MPGRLCRSPRSRASSLTEKPLSRRRIFCDRKPPSAGHPRGLFTKIPFNTNKSEKVLAPHRLPSKQKGTTMSYDRQNIPARVPDAVSYKSVARIKAPGPTLRNLYPIRAATHKPMHTHHLTPSQPIATHPATTPTKIAILRRVPLYKIFTSTTRRTTMPNCHTLQKNRKIRTSRGGAHQVRPAFLFREIRCLASFVAR